MILRRYRLNVAVLVFVALSWWLVPALQTDAAEDFASLYAQIESANSRSGNSTITLSEDITLSAALPPITGDITIDGGGHSISGDGMYRIFDVNGGRLMISNLTLTEGNAPDEEDGGAMRLRNGAEVIVSHAAFTNNGASNGGAIATMTYNVRLNVSQSSFTSNSASKAGGAIATFGGISDITGSAFSDNDSVASGGAIAVNEGRVRVSNRTLSGNQSASGGAIYTDAGEATLTHITAMNNEARESNGSGIHRERGIVYLRNSIVGAGVSGTDCVGFLSEKRGNISQDGTCSDQASGDPLLEELAGSPAHYPLKDGSPAVDSADPEYCLGTDQLGTARPQGGGCDIGAIESTTASPSPETVEAFKCSLADHIRSANSNTSVGGCPAGTSHDIITITDDITLREELPPIRGTITIEGNGHTISGGGKYRILDVSGGRLTIKDLTLTDGYTQEDGGAIRLRSGGRLTVENTIFQDNWAYRGGVIAMLSADVAVTVNSSSFVENAAELQGGVFFLNGGSANINSSSFVDNHSERAWGGVFHARGSRLSVSNSTFKGNEGLAGGVLATLSGQATMTHVTMIDNRSDFLGGDALFRRGGMIVLRNSIVSNRGEIEDCSGGLTVEQGNLSTDGTCSAVPGSDFRLDNLTGSPAYFPLKDGSPALDAAIADFCPATDQIGTARPQGGGCDIGAVESATAELAPAPVVPPPPCPLSDQIIAANTDAPSGGCLAGDGHDIITLTEDITLSGLLPRITSEITIEGNGHTISGDGRFRIFNVTDGTLTLNNLTLTKGSVPPNAKGGAVYSGGALITLTHVTMMDNLASNGRSILAWEERPGRVRLRNSILFGGRSSSLHCAGSPLEQSRGNLVGDRSCAAAAGAAPLLGDLTGSPAYYPLKTGSPAIDAADAAFCPDTDQIGAARPQGGSCDSGAIESTTARP